MRNTHTTTARADPGQVRYLSDRYDASIRQADDALGPFLDHLATSGHLDDTIVVITSDHGEEFWEHGQIGGHALSLHREVLMVPLVILGPGDRARARFHPDRTGGSRPDPSRSRGSARTRCGGGCESDRPSWGARVPRSPGGIGPRHLRGSW